MKRTEPRGFTLLELMVSMSIGTLVLLLAAASLKSTGDSYDRTTAGVGAEREARAVLTQAAEDLSKAVRGNVVEFGKGGGGWRQDKLGFLCLQPADAQNTDERIGDLCAVVYYPKDLKIGRDTVRCLMRGFRGSAATFDALRGDTVKQLYEGQPQDEPVAFGVIAFEVDPLVRTNVGGWGKWDEAGDLKMRGPDVVRLRLVVARRELVARLRSSSDWQSSPLIGRPEDVANSKLMEVYEIVQPYAHGA